MAAKGEVRVRFVGDTSSLDKAMKQVGASTVVFGQTLNQLERNLNRVGATATAAGRTLSIGITAPLVAAGAMSLKLASDFDDAMNQSVAIMGKLDKSMRATMEKTARDVAKTTVHSAEDAAKSFYYLASAGMTAEQSVAALPKVAAFAQAGMFDMARATEYLTDSTKAMGLSSQDAAENAAQLARVSDVLTLAAVKSNGSVEQFAAALTNKAGPAMRAFGVELESGVAVLAAFADQGIKGETAGERLDILLRTLTKAAVQHSQAFRDAGIAVFDTAGKLRNVADIIQDVEKAFTGLNAEQRVNMMMNLGIKAQSQSAVLALVGMSEKIRDYERDLRSAGGATEEIAKKQMESFKQQMLLLKKSVEDVGISLGQALMPAARAAAEGVKTHLIPALESAIKWFGQLPPSAQLAGIGIGAIAAAAGPVLYALGGMSQGVSSLIGTYKMLAALPIASTMGTWASAFGVAEAAGGALGLALRSVSVVAAALIGYKLGSWFVESTAAGQKLVDMISKLILMAQGVSPVDLANMEKGVTHPGDKRAYNDGKNVDLTHLPGSTWASLGPKAPPPDHGATTGTKPSKRDDAFLDTVTGGKAQHEMDLLTGYFNAHRSAVEGNANAYETLIKKVQALHDKGALLPPVFQEIVDRMHEMYTVEKPDELPINPAFAPEIPGVGRRQMGSGLFTTADTTLIAGANKPAADAGPRSVDWSKGLEDLAHFAQIFGGSSSTVGRMVGNVTAGGSAGQGFHNSFFGADGNLLDSLTKTSYDAKGNPLKSLDVKQLFSAKNFNSTLAGGMQMAQGIGQLISSTSTGGYAQRALGGAQTGLGLGASFGPTGAAAGAGVGALFGIGRRGGTLGNIASVFSPAALAGNVVGHIMGKPAGEKAGDEYARGFGLKASDELKHQTADMAKNLGIGMHEATLLNMPAAIAESGKSASLYAGQVTELLNAVKNGAVPAREGIASTGAAFAMMAADAQSAGSVGDVAMRSVIDRTKELGIVVPEVQAHVRDGLTSAGAGLQGFFQIGAAAADAQVTIFRSTFDALVGEFGIRGAAEKIGPAYEMLTKNLEAAGLDAVAVLGDIAGEMGAATNEQFAKGSDAARSLDQVVQGLANSSVPLSITQFQAFGAGAQAAYELAIAGAQEAGMTHEQAVNAALREVGPLLGTLVSASANYGVALDANTQSLVDQAKAAGIAFPTDGSDRLRASIDALTSTLGGIPPQFEAITGSINSLPTEKGFVYKISYQTSGGPPAPSNRGSSTPPPIDPDDLEPHARGTVSTTPHPAMIHGSSSNPEIVSPLDALLQSVGRGLADRTAELRGGSGPIGTAGGAGAGGTVQLNGLIDGQVLVRWILDKQRLGVL